MRAIKGLRVPMTSSVSGASKFAGANHQLLGHTSILQHRLVPCIGQTSSRKFVSSFASGTAVAQDDVQLYESGNLVEETTSHEKTQVEVLDQSSINNYEIEPEILRNLEKIGIKDLFPVQKVTIDKARAGKDLLVQSKTGSGKTLAFGLPLLEIIMRTKREILRNGEKRFAASPLGIVMAPTRELAMQVHTELRKYAPQITSACVYGGVPYSKQLQDVRVRGGLDLLIGTPGRLCDMLERGNINLSRVKVAVLDEADEMLKMGFAKEVDAIYEGMPNAQERQNLLFSATFAREIQNIARKYMNDAEHINLVGKDDSKIPDDIKMLSLVSRWKNREEQLGNILNLYCSGKDGIRALVFTSTKLGCERLASSAAIVQSGVMSLPLHGDMSQNARENALEAFRSRRVKCLIATDVAARGLDIPEVDLVIHYELPQQKESFVHRTGRTGRAGRAGINIVMHDTNQKHEIRDIERHIQRKFAKMPQPRACEIANVKGDAIIEKILNMPQNNVSNYNTIAERLRKHLEVEGMEIDPLAASICLASGLESNFSFSDLTGEEAVETIYVSCSNPSSLRLPSNLRKETVSTHDFFKVKDRMESLVSEIVSEDYKAQNRNRIVRHVEICKDLKGVLLDVPPDVADRLKDTCHDEHDISFHAITDRLPEYVEVQRNQNNNNRNNKGRRGGGGGRYENRGDRRGYNEFKGRRQGNRRRNNDNVNKSPTGRRDRRQSHSGSW